MADIGPTLSAAGRAPTFGQALVPVVGLITMLAASVYLYGDESSAGPNQIALILGTGIAVLVGMANGYRWKELEQGISRVSPCRWAPS